MSAPELSDNMSENTSITYGDVPTAMYMCSERVRLLLNNLHIIKGWNPEVARLKMLSIHHIVSAGKNLSEVKSLIFDISSTVKATQAKHLQLLLVKQRILFILNNLPKRYNKLTENTVQQEVLSNGQEALQSTTQQSTIVPPVTYITQEEYDSIPKYLKGRIPYDKINNTIDLFNSVLEKKYKIARQKKSALKNRDVDLWTKFKKQELKETNGLFFCVLEDFKTLGGAGLDRTSQNILNILRHCGRLREIRVSGMVRFVAMY